MWNAGMHTLRVKRYLEGERPREPHARMRHPPLEGEHPREPHARMRHPPLEGERPREPHPR